MRLRRLFRDGCGKCASLSFVVLLCVSVTRAQGPAPETAPPLFPGGGLISYNSTFTTRGLTPESTNIFATARPTSWRRHRNTGSSQLHYVRFVRAPPSNGIGLIRSFCARWIAAFTTIFALFKNLGWEEKYCLSWQSSSSGSAHAPAYQ